MVNRPAELNVRLSGFAIGSARIAAQAPLTGNLDDAPLAHGTSVAREALRAPLRKQLECLGKLEWQARIDGSATCLGAPSAPNASRVGNQALQHLARAGGAQLGGQAIELGLGFGE